METVLSALLLFIGGFMVGAVFQEWLTRKTALSKENIVACFKDVDWTYNTFSANGIIQTAKDGTSKFYKVASIDEAINKLNKLIK